MSPLPYLPGGQAELPASRIMLFADGANLVQRIDESSKTLNGVSFDGRWVSKTLNEDVVEELTISYLTLFYISAVTTTMSISVTGDGGETWPETKQVDILATTADRIDRVQAGFNTTGFDVRIRLELDTDEVFNVLSLYPVLVRRGEYVQP